MDDDYAVQMNANLERIANALEENASATIALKQEIWEIKKRWESLLAFQDPMYGAAVGLREVKYRPRR